VTARALVTGASSGIGEAFARRLAAQGTSVVLVARREERLVALAGELAGDGVEAEVLVADLAAEDGLAAVEARMASSQRPVDLLVNNAGFGSSGDFAELDLATELEMVQLNVVAVVRLTRAALDAMVPRGGGGVVNVSSLAGILALPGSAIYGASKAFVTSFTEALAAENRGSGVHFQALCPGLVRTEFHESADWHVGPVPRLAWSTPEQVVDASLAALGSARVVVVPTALYRLGAAAVRPLPRRLVSRVVAAVARRR